MGQKIVFSDLDASYFEESVEMLENAASLLISAEKDGTVASAIPEVFRTFHTIKGGAQLVGCDMLAEFAHKMEDLLDHVRTGRRPADADIAALVLDTISLMEEEIDLYRGGETPDELTDKQTILLNRAEKLAPHGKKQLEKDKIAHPAVAQAIEPTVSETKAGKRLIYALFLLDSSAPMPEITEFLVKKRLEEIGKIIHIMRTDSWFMGLEAILQTDLEDQDLRKYCNAAAVNEIHLKELSPASFNLGLLPHGAIEEFIAWIGELNAALNSPESPLKEIVTLIERLAEWGNRYVESSGCFPGGRPEWDRAVNLLRQAGVLWTGSRSTPEQVLLMTSLAQNLWEWVFSSLRNRVYFFCLRPTGSTAGTGLLQAVKSRLKGGSAKVMIVDLSEISVLESGDIEAIKETRKWLKERHMEMVTIAEGEYRHRHQNAFEALAGELEGLQVHASAYSAFCSGALTSHIVGK